MYNMIKIRNKHINEQVYGSYAHNTKVHDMNASLKQNLPNILSSPENNRLESENTSLKSALEEQIELTEKLENQLYKIQMENKKIIRDNINKLSLDISTEIKAQNIVFVESDSDHSSIEDSEPTVMPIVKKTTLKPVKPKPPKIIF